MKYIIVTGGVISGLGKGIAASSIGLILKAYGLTVTAIKIDPYINVTSDLMSPYEHGEAYVLNDGCVTDLDLGNYERFLNIELCGDHSITTGKVYENVIKKERKGDYLGKTVQIVPHITDYIQEHIQRIAVQSVTPKAKTPDICIIELGGTIGDIEGLIYTEALSQLTRTKLKQFEYCFVHLSLVPTIHGDEIKTKPTQHSIKNIRREGINPDILILRTTRKLKEEELLKVEIMCQINRNNIIVNHDVDSIYDVPKILIEQNISGILSKRLKLHLEKITPRFDEYNMLWNHLKYTKERNGPYIHVGIIGKYTGMQDTYLSLIRALEMASFNLHTCAKIHWISSELPETEMEKMIVKVDRIVIPGGFGIRGIEGMIKGVTLSKRHSKPILGICLGCQIIVIEHARSIGLEKANSTEFDLNTPHPVVIECADTKILGGTMRLGTFALLTPLLAHARPRTKESTIS